MHLTNHSYNVKCVRSILGYGGRAALRLRANRVEVEQLYSLRWNIECDRAQPNVRGVGTYTWSIAQLVGDLEDVERARANSYLQQVEYGDGLILNLSVITDAVR